MLFVLLYHKLPTMPIIEVKPGFVCSEMSKYYDKGNFFLLIFILYIPLINIFAKNDIFLS